MGIMMLYRQKLDTFIRIYDGNVGYIVNKGNFDDCVSEGSGAVFLGVLTRNPRSLDEITEETAKVFSGVDKTVLRKDIAEFFRTLEDNGFIVSGENKEELDRKDSRFSYSAYTSQIKGNTPVPFRQRAKKTTQEYMAEYFEHNPVLISFQIELSSRCNERCVHCYIPNNDKTTDLDPSLFYNVLDQCADLGVLDLTLSGGEPMLHNDFCDFLRYAKKHDFSVSILSNLTALSDEIIAELKTNQLASIQTSLYSMDPLIHDSVTQLEGSFHKTYDNILKLINNDIPLQISCPTMKQNKDSYIDVMKWAHEHKCRAATDYLLIGRYDGTTDNLSNRLSLDEIEPIINTILNNDKNYQDEILSENLDNIDKHDRSDDIVCGICISTICMTANGNIFPCPGWQDYTVGNIKDASLKKIWETSSKVKYLRSLRIRNFPKCTACPDLNFCALCMVRNANENPDGDIFRVNEHFCKVAALNKKIVTNWLNKELSQGK